MGDIDIGAHASIWPTAVLRGDMGKITIGESTSIQDGTICHATSGLSETRIGNRVTVNKNTARITRDGIASQSSETRWGKRETNYSL